MAIGRWTKTDDGRWLADGIRGTWELAQESDGRPWKLTLYRSDLSTRPFGEFISRIEGEGHAFMLDARGN
jgi:hypothetical protein